MGFDLPVLAAAGIQDAFVPVQVAIGTVFVLVLVLLRACGKRVLVLSVAAFITGLVLFGIMGDLSFFDPVTATPLFLTVIKWFFLAAGLLSTMVAVMFFKEWRLLSKDTGRPFAACLPAIMAGVWSGPLAVFLLAGVLVFLVSVWPFNYQVMLQATNLLSPGVFFYTLTALVVYELCRNALVLLLTGVLVVAALRQDHLRCVSRSLLSIIVSAFFFVAGGALFFFFYVAATKPWL